MLPPEEYEMYREEGMAMGFKYVASGPLVSWRSERETTGPRP